MKRRDFMTTSLLSTSRRFVNAGIGAALTIGSAAGNAKTKSTGSQQEGPYYPTEAIPVNEDLVHYNDGAAEGEYLELRGAISDQDGIPLSALIEIWQCDAAGRYRHAGAPNHSKVDRHFAGSGAYLTGKDGNYRFLTLMPVPYTGRPPHIHVKIHVKTHRNVRTEKSEVLTTQLYLKESGYQPALSIDPVMDENLKAATFNFII